MVTWDEIDENPALAYVPGNYPAEDRAGYPCGHPCPCGWSSDDCR